MSKYTQQNLQTIFGLCTWPLQSDTARFAALLNHFITSNVQAPSALDPLMGSYTIFRYIVIIHLEDVLNMTL